MLTLEVHHPHRGLAFVGVRIGLLDAVGDLVAIARADHAVDRRQAIEILDLQSAFGGGCGTQGAQGQSGRTNDGANRRGKTTAGWVHEASLGYFFGGVA
jgi:hypothetical protein